MKATFHITYWFALLSAFILLFLLKIHFPDFFQILQDILLLFKLFFNGVFEQLGHAW